MAFDAAAPPWANTLFQTLQQQGRDERARYDEMQQHVSRLVAAELEREERAESRRERTSGYDPEPDDWSSGYGSDDSRRSSRPYGSSDSSASNLSDYAFVPVRESNPHWGARVLAAAQDDEPKRHDLYGNKAFDSLCSGRHERGGTLGWSLEYGEAISLHLYSANDELRDIIGQLGHDDPLRTRLCSLLRTNDANYNLANEFRELIKVQARAVRPGATEADKSESKFIVRTFEERDYATGDVPKTIAMAKADFAYAARKSELNHLARRGGGGGGGDDYRERSRDERERGTRRGRRGGRQKGDRDQRSDRRSRDGERGNSSRADARRGNERREERGDGRRDNEERRDRRDQDERRDRRSHRDNDERGEQRRERRVAFDDERGESRGSGGRGGGSSSRGRGRSGGDRGGGSPRGGSGARRDTAREARRGGASRGGRHDRRNAGADDGGASSSGESF